ncbi:MAG TPA: glutamate-1-semialdehyde 2,1-aminomutase [Candidatus Methanomethylophilaceae archaeon]|nr:glutamate-1-semialdehyde 2,1-aminomutase [Candidatus Methanomethylophilaceae archaeon]
MKISPGGVSSPVRAFKPNPLFIESAKGSKIRDVDGNEYVDYCMSYGPMIAGHACDYVLNAVKEQMYKGTLYGAPSEIELELLELISKKVPSAEMVRLACSGAEATMHAIRAARGFTKRDGIVKMNGGYHGAHDSVLADRDEGYKSRPGSEGIPKEVVKNTFVAEYNDIESLVEVIDAEKPACVIMEPVMGNIGVVTPNKGYLEEVRKITKETDTVLIFDEVITGFRLSEGGAQKLYNVIPDMTTCAKIMGGGFSGSAFMGKREIMDMIAPSGKIYAAGTYAGNPVSAAAGKAQIEYVSERYNDLNNRSEELKKSLSDILVDNKINGCVNGIGSMLMIYFGNSSVNNGTEALNADRTVFGKLFDYMLNKGIYLAPSAMESWFVSTAHTSEDIVKLTNAFDSFLKEVKL